MAFNVNDGHQNKLSMIYVTITNKIRYHPEYYSGETNKPVYLQC